jgi:hypothetical protein
VRRGKMGAPTGGPHMPEPTLEDLAARVAALEAQVAMLSASRLPPAAPALEGTGGLG